MQCLSQGLKRGIIKLLNIDSVQQKKTLQDKRFWRKPDLASTWGLLKRRVGTWTGGIESLYFAGTNEPDRQLKYWKEVRVTFVECIQASALAVLFLLGRRGRKIARTNMCLHGRFLLRFSLNSCMRYLLRVSKCPSLCLDDNVFWNPNSLLYLAFPYVSLEGV